MCAQGNVLGTIIFILVYNIPNVDVRWKGMFLGYEKGLRFVNDAAENGIFDKLTESAKVLGLVVIGGMMASMVKLQSILELQINDAVINIQSICDSIFPSLLPLLATLLVWKMLKKGISTTLVLIGIIIIAIAGRFFGII